MSQPSEIIPNSSVEVKTIAADLNSLRESLEEQVPYTGGIHVVKPEDLVIYYDVDGEMYPRRIDLGNATEEDLLGLAAACDQATFGVNQKDVLDESYRKAGKMELSKFAARLDVVASGLVDAISADILEGQDADGDKILRAELYKLNVYGPDSFFKAHKDTPRGETMIGSLVIIFPTSHTGGALTLEHGGKTWTFDSAAELSARAVSPALSYVAFYSDVTHAVERVQTGHRVTLTYNLFLVDKYTARGGVIRPGPSPESAAESALRKLLANPAFLPGGGFLAYGLSHQYPMPQYPIPPPKQRKILTDAQQKPASQLGPVLRLLKGSDARVRTVSARVGLATQVKLLYHSGTNSHEDGHDVLADGPIHTEDVHAGFMDLLDEIEKMGVVIERGEERTLELREQAGWWHDEVPRRVHDPVPVHWVTKITEHTRVHSTYIAYGNDASIGHVYGNAALFAQVPAFGQGIRG
ncbi:hypothetical protein DFH08DRAFT_790188 [Mycena albidolilacea]|uniref:Fe2OG dioxygenase domain-containing protein n=1 Tax=Mycena albidolilacea TaxID=1033008 RepID=A0AAD7EE75_9AGAR|nr:hypothetical protein DFH08DRAFT_790188 [Mycena albidolilacea]